MKITQPVNICKTGQCTKRLLPLSFKLSPLSLQLSAFCLSVLLFGPAQTFAAEFDGTLKEVKITDSSGTNQPPSAVLTYTQSGSTFTFDASGSSDPDGTIAEYKWDFGDGITLTGTNVIHELANGTFSITLTIVDNDGAVSISQLILENTVCSDTPTVIQSAFSSLAKIGNFSNLYFEGTTYRSATSINTCKIDIAMKRYEGDISGKNFYVKIYTLDEKNNLSTLQASSLPVSGANLTDTCQMISFEFDSPAILNQNNAIVIHMDGATDSKNYASACYEAYKNPYLDGELGTWYNDLNVNTIRTDGSDLAFKIYGTKK